MKHFKDVLEKKAASQKPMGNLEKSAKLRAIQDMRKMASDEMVVPLKGLKKVTVASNSPEGVEAGLEKARAMVSEHKDSPEMQALEEEMGEDLDHDMEMGEDSEHAEHVLGEEDEEATEMSPEEMQAKIAELEALLKAKK